jgi:predicted acyl esterase
MAERFSRRIGFLLAILTLAAPAHGQRLLVLLGKNGPPATEVMVPMRDGTTLATDFVLPPGKGPWPVVLTRTPYGKGTPGLAGIEPDFVKQGYARVIQDVRGRYKSGGTFGSFDKEISDGYDTVAWIAKQPWCNGKVGMYGVSAGGILANFAAMAAPPNLACNFVCVAHGCDYRYGSFPGGCFLLDMNERWFRGLGHPIPVAPRPRIEDYDADWASRDMSRHYASVRVPTYNVAGWFDIFSESGLENFAGLQQHGGDGAKGNQKIRMGAFGHFPISGKLKYPPKASVPDLGECVAWFDHWLKGVDNGILREPAVRYFLMGDPLDPDAPGNEWRTSEHWPPKADVTSFHLIAGGKLRREIDGTGGADAYQYDPRNPVPTIGGNNLFLPRGPMDQREIGQRADVLKYATDPLDAPVEVVGPIVVELFVGTDAEDTDFCAKLVDVYEDGYEALVVDQPLRLRYRNGFDKPEKAKKDEVYKIRVNLWSTALVFNRGHRIALHVSSSNSPRFEPHTNTWTPVSTYDQSVVATNKVHRGAERASRVLLPVTKVYDKK